MKILPLLLSLLFAASSFGQTQQRPRPTPTPAPVTEVFAHADDGTPLTWNVYAPTTSGTHPAMLIIHPGGFIHNDGGTMMTNCAKDFAALGYITFIPQYRLAPPGSIPGQISSGQYPDQYNDIKLAVKTARYDLRGNGQVAAVGGSAGGTHALFVSVGGSVGDERVDVAVGLSGAYEFDDPNSLKNPSFANDVTSYVGSSVPINLFNASPVAFIFSPISPVLMYQSQGDPMPKEQLPDMVAALQAAGITNYQAYIIAGSAHSFANWPAVRLDAIAFVQSVINP